MPKTANEEILDATVRHQIRLLRFFQGEAQKFAELLAQSDAELVALLQLGLTDTLEARIRGLLTEVRRMRAAVAERIQVELEEDMEGLFKTEAEWEVFMLQGATPIALFFNAVLATVVKAVAGFFINGILLQGWLGKMATNDVARIEQQIRLGVFQGETIDQMVRRIRGTKAGGYKDGVLETTRREAEMIARTATNHVFTAARQATWDANADVIKGVWWVATLDGRTFFVCQSRDGEVYPIDKGPRPPAHPNCRLTVAPVLHGEEIVGDRPTVTDTRTRRQREIDFWAEAKEAAGDKWKGMFAAERNAAIKARRDKWADENIGQTLTLTNYQLWLKGQFKEFQDEVLGKGKAQLFWDGLPLEKFVDEKGKPYFLAELKAELEGDKLNVIQPGVGLKAKLLLQQGMLPFEVLDQIKQEFLDAFTLAAFIAFYKFELNKAGALNLGPAFKVPAGALKQAKAVADVVADLDAFLPPNLKHAVGGQWFTVVDDLDGLPGAYGYYQAGKGVVLSGKKLFVLPAAQAKQVAAHELGYLLYKQHDLLLDPDVLAALKALAKGLFLDARKLYLYYLTSADELVAEVYGQALSPSAVTFQGLFAIEFNKAFGFAIQAAKDAMAKKFFVPPAGAKVLLLGGPALPYEVAGKHTLVGLLAKALLQQGMPDDQVLKAVFAEFLEAQTKQAFIALYKFQLKKDGLLPNKAFGPVVAAKPILDVVPVPLFGAAAVVAPEAAATQFALTLTLAQLKDEAIKLMQKGMLFNQDLAETLAKQFFANAADVKVTNIATWKFNWKKLSPNFYNHAVLLFEKATVKEAVLGPVQKPKLADQKLGGTFFFALDKVKFVLAAGGGLQDAYEAMKLVFGVIKQPGADDLLELAQYQLALAKAAGKPYLNAAFTKPTGFVFNGKIEKFTAQLPASGKAALEAYKKAKQQGLGPINTNKLVKKMAGYEPFATMKVKLKEAAEYELKKQGTATVFFNEATVAKKQGVAPTAVDMTAFWPAFTPRDGLLPPLRYLGAQRAAGVRKFANGLPTGDLAAVNAKQRLMGLQELTAEEVAAVKAYTGNTYRALNNALWAGKYLLDPHLQAYVDAAQHGMFKMPKFQGVSFCGMTFNDLQLKAMLFTYRKGAVVEDFAFVLLFYGEQAAFSGNVYMRINGKTGVNVFQYLYYKTEREVLFMPGTRFWVDDVVQQNGKYIITVTEV